MSVLLFLFQIAVKGQVDTQVVLDSLIEQLGQPTDTTVWNKTVVSDCPDTLTGLFFTYNECDKILVRVNGSIIIFSNCLGGVLGTDPPQGWVLINGPVELTYDSVQAMTTAQQQLFTSFMGTGGQGAGIFKIPLVTGINEIEIIVTNSYFQTSAWDLFLLRKKALEVFVADSLTVCAGEPVVLEAMANGADSLSWSWEGVNGVISNVQNPEIMFQTPGEQVIIVTATNSNGCEASDTMLINVVSSDTTEIYSQTCLPAEAGTTIDSFQNIGGCDSLVFHIVELLPSPEIFMDEYIASCDSTLLIPMILSSDSIVGMSWSNGSTGDSIVVMQSGTYTVTVTNNDGCTAMASSQVEIVPTPEIVFSPQPEFICVGDEITLSVSGNGVSSDGYWIHNFGFGSKIYEEESLYFQSVTVNQTGIWTYYASNDIGCEAVDSFVLVVQLPPVIVTTDITICQNEDFLLSVDTIWTNNPYSITINGPNGFLHDEQSFLFDADEVSEDLSGEYIITVTDLIIGCASQEILHLEVQYCCRTDESIMYIPNAFSPDGDCNNDIFKLYTDKQSVFIETFEVFNRWGGKVYGQEKFYPAIDDHGWDGFVKGKMSDLGVYVYHVQGSCSDGTPIMRKGEINIISSNKNFTK